ncbi:hypothetical protein SCUCBS95973_008372 [Sporothrix curviconia]|uniref:Guanylate kinase-like domain-containing protein n=1 Tax=Sporothrix curviconia TaxID=1260050 RepID=A0ABP0CL20_9PEZI
MPVKAVFLDFMGTCLDWHSSVVAALPSSLSQDERSALALTWRQAFFDDIRRRPPGETPEDINVVHERILQEVLAREESAHFRQAFLPLPSSIANSDLSAPAISTAVRAWHSMRAWPDVLAGLQCVRDALGCEVFVLANGTTRLQLDLVRSSGLAPVVDMLFSSELLGVAKPTPAIYRRALGLVGVEPEQGVMVAAHAYDLRAAKAVGLQTVYIRRWTDDLDETDEGVKQLKSILSTQEDVNYRFIFVRPPDFAKLESRLRGRGTEDETSVQRRLARPRDEIAYSETPGVHDKIIVNTDLDAAYKELDEFIFRKAERSGKDA